MRISCLVLALTCLAVQPCLAQQNSEYRLCEVLLAGIYPVVLRENDLLSVYFGFDESEALIAALRRREERQIAPAILNILPRLGPASVGYELGPGLSDLDFQIDDRSPAGGRLVLAGVQEAGFGQTLEPKSFAKLAITSPVRLGYPQEFLSDRQEVEIVSRWEEVSDESPDEEVIRIRRYPVHNVVVTDIAPLLIMRVGEFVNLHFIRREPGTDECSYGGANEHNKISLLQRYGWKNSELRSPEGASLYREYMVRYRAGVPGRTSVDASLFTCGTPERCLPLRQDIEILP